MATESKYLPAGRLTPGTPIKEAGPAFGNNVRTIAGNAFLFGGQKKEIGWGDCPNTPAAQARAFKEGNKEIMRNLKHRAELAKLQIQLARLKVEAERMGL